jgi:hypothetical protein
VGAKVVPLGFVLVGHPRRLRRRSDTHGCRQRVGRVAKFLDSRREIRGARWSSAVTD